MLLRLHSTYLLARRAHITAFAAMAKRTDKEYVDNALPESERKPYTLDIATEPLINIVGAAAQALRDGGCIALPSDTVYGLVSLRSNMTRLFDIKHRDASKPIGFFVRDPAIIEQYAETTAPTRALLHKLLPGKVTLLLKRRVMANDATLNLPPLVGFRVPDDALIRALCEHLDEPLAQTSANVSGAPSSLVCKDFAELWSQLDLLITDSSRKVEERRREGSTIVDLSVPNCYRIVRAGCALEHYVNILMAHNLKSH